MGGEQYTVGKVTALAIQRAIKLPERRKIFLSPRSLKSEADGKRSQEVPSGWSHHSPNFVAGARRCLRRLRTTISHDFAFARHSSQLEFCRHRGRLKEQDDMIFTDGKHSRLCVRRKKAASEVLANINTRTPSPLRTCRTRVFRMLVGILSSSLETVLFH